MNSLLIRLSRSIAEDVGSADVGDASGALFDAINRHLPGTSEDRRALIYCAVAEAGATTEATVLAAIKKHA